MRSHHSNRTPRRMSQNNHDATETSPPAAVFHSRDERQHWTKALSGVVIAGSILSQALFFSPSPAEAGFGSGGAAAFSPPLLKIIEDRDFLALPKSKQLQRATGVVCEENDKTCERNVDRLIRNLDKSESEDMKQIEEMRSTINDMVKRVNERAKQSELEGMKSAEEEQLQELEGKVLEATERSQQLLQQKVQLEQQLKDRQEFLNLLASQPAWVSYFAAALGSVVSTLVMHPVDTLKTRMMTASTDDDNRDDGSNTGGNGGDGDSMQNINENLALHYSTDDANFAGSEAYALTAFTMYSNNTSSSWQSESSVATVMQSSPPRNDDSSDASPRISSSIGSDNNNGSNDMNILSLYQGLLPNVLKEAPASALYLGVYEVVRQQLSTVPVLASYPLLVYLLSGAVGEVFGSIVRAPAEAVKTKVQTSDMQVSEALEASLLGDGLKQTFRAWTSSLFRDVPFGGIQLAIFEGLKSAIISSPNIEFDVSTLFGEATIGLFAGAAGAFLTTPMDRVTTQILSSTENQAMSSTVIRSEDGDVIGTEGVAPPSPIEAMMAIYEEDGFAGLFTGAKERTLYWAPAIAIFLSVYCKTRQIFALKLGI